MKRLLPALLSILLVALVGAAQSPQQRNVLHLIKAVPLPGIEGDFDHFGLDLEGNRLFLAAEDHKSVEVFDLRTGKPIHSITGFDTPHSVLYVPESKQVFVTDGGDGSCKILNGETYEVVKTVKLSADADPVAYDTRSKYLYVGNGGKEAHQSFSLISIIDTASGEHIGDIKIDSTNLEAMAIEKSRPKLFVNIRDKAQVGIVDLEKRTVVGTWSLNGVAHNTPMALDEANHRLFIVGRNPGKFVVLDTESGKEIATLPSPNGADDMSFDAGRKHIYVSYAEGFVAVYEQQDADHYRPIGKISTGFRAKISILVPQLNRYYVAVSKNGKEEAKLLIFDVAQ